MSNIDALMGLGISEEEQLKMLADSLRGRQRAADFFALSSVEPISRAAEGEQKRVNTSAAQAGLLNKALQERRLTESEGAKDRAALLKRAQIAAESGYGYRGSGRYFNVQPVRLAPTEQYPEGQVVMFGTNPKTNQFEQIPGLPEGATINPMGEYQMHRSTKDIPSELQPLYELTAAIDRVDKIFSPHAEGSKDPMAVGDIPGAGRVSGKPGRLGWIARMIEESQGQDPHTTYQAVRNLQNYLIKEQSGLTQSIMEIARQEEVFGQEFLTDPEAFMAHLDWLKDLLTNRLDQVISMQSAPVQSRIRGHFGENNPFDWEPQRYTMPKGNGLYEDMTDSSEFGGMPDRDIGWSDEQERRYQELLAKQRAQD